MSLKKWLIFYCLFSISYIAVAEPEFDINSNVLSLPIVRVNGTLYRNVELLLSADGTWAVQAIEAPKELIIPICDVDREVARNDALEAHTDKYTPNFSLIESLLENDMEAYDEICAMPETIVLLEILNELSEKYYPNFSLIQSLTESDLEAHANLYN